MKNLDDKSKELLGEIIKESSPSKLERMKLVIEKSDVDEDTKNELSELIENASQPSDEDADIPKSLVDALKADGMREYLSSLVEEAKNDAIKEMEDNAEPKSDDDNNDDMKVLLVDSIISNATALCLSEINLEDIEGSQEEYKGQLNEKNTDELKELSKDLHKQVADALSNSPSETLEDEGMKEDGTTEDTSDKKLSDIEQVIASYFKR
jgi:hypothetical protein